MSFVKVYFDFEERTEMLNEVEQGRLLLTMLRYAQGKTLPELKGNERFLFPVFKADIDREAAIYATKIDNGAKGGRPKQKTENNLTKPDETEDNLNRKNKNKNKNKNKTEEQEREGVNAHVVRFTPPTVEEVSAYASEKGWKKDVFSPERFVDFYGSKGWLVGKTPMKDWKAAARGWVSRSDAQIQAKAQTNPALNYEQREYKDEDFQDYFLDLDNLDNYTV